jgi:hypothetical protein
MTNDGSNVAFSRGRVVLVGTAETLHGWCTFSTDGLKLSLKLYHANELQLVHQQSMTQAPNKRATTAPNRNRGSTIHGLSNLLADQDQLENTLQIISIKAGFNDDRFVRGMFDPKKYLHFVALDS